MSSYACKLKILIYKQMIVIIRATGMHNYVDKISCNNIGMDGVVFVMIRCGLEGSGLFVLTPYVDIR